MRSVRCSGRLAAGRCVRTSDLAGYGSDVGGSNCAVDESRPTTGLMANVVAPHHQTRAFAPSLFFQHALATRSSPSLIGAVSDALQSLSTAVQVVPAAWLGAGVVWVMGA